jgi:invasion protein IalB
MPSDGPIGRGATAMRMIIFSLALTFGHAAHAQDTPGNWRPTLHKMWGLWDLICDEQGAAESLEQRCYLRYVDVFSPAPQFAGHFVFITYADGTPRFEYGAEHGTRFDVDGWAIHHASGALWTPAQRTCLRGGPCVYEGDAAIPLITALRDGGQMEFRFTDRHGIHRDLTWTLDGVAEALDELIAESAARGI